MRVTATQPITISSIQPKTRPSGNRTIAEATTTQPAGVTVSPTHSTDARAPCRSRRDTRIHSTTAPTRVNVGDVLVRVDAYRVCVADRAWVGVRDRVDVSARRDSV